MATDTVESTLRAIGAAGELPQVAGQCGQRVDPATFDDAVAAHPASRLNVTDNPIF